MKAVVINGPNDLRLQDSPAPVIAPDEVLIRPRASTICHSDYELIGGRYIIPFSYPITPGHEWSGEVVEVGKNVTRFKPGDRVVGESVIGCNSCVICQSGNFTNCPNADHFGFTINGADAEYTKARPEWLHKLPDGVSFKQGALVEPFSVSYGAICAMGGVDAGETMVVFGGGPIGLFAVAAGSAMGARVILVEPMASRQEVGRRLGASEVIDPREEQVAERVQALTDGFGADLIIEASGAEAALTATLDVARNNGRIACVGIRIGQSISVEMGKIQIKGLNLKGIVGSPYVWERTLTFLNRSGLDITPVVTHDFPLSRAEEAFALASQRDKCIKVMLMND
ncbi:MAG: alcohol dehydrogenase [Chloroflexota bacterium]|nr:MAG: alcohol dehydrogenase [Chloroflexota bacterium]